MVVIRTYIATNVVTHTHTQKAKKMANGLGAATNVVTPPSP